MLPAFSARARRRIWSSVTLDEFAFGLRGGCIGSQPCSSGRFAALEKIAINANPMRNTAVAATILDLVNGTPTHRLRTVNPQKKVVGRLLTSGPDRNLGTTNFVCLGPAARCHPLSVFDNRNGIYRLVPWIAHGYGLSGYLDLRTVDVDGAREILCYLLANLLRRECRIDAIFSNYGVPHRIRNCIRPSSSTRRLHR